jgi:peptidoglycan/xylan/chitin deacetylase (PgdA/CDA1 family)
MAKRSFLVILAALCIVRSLNVSNANAREMPSGAERTVAITLDDLPYVYRGGEFDRRDFQDPGIVASYRKEAIRAHRRIVRALRRAKAPAIGFVNEDKVEVLGSVGPQLLADWNQGLLELANHGYNHFESNDLDAAGVEEQVIKGEKTIRPMAERVGRRISFFRFPYNHVGNTDDRRVAFEAMLQRRGYRLAAATIDTSDSVFNKAYERAFEQGDQAVARRVLRAYLDHTQTQITYYRELSRKVFGREVPDIMLLHTNRINAEAMESIVTLFRAQNYRFISLAEAQADPAYATMPATSTGYGPMWGYRWARERKIKVDGRLEQEPPIWISEYAAGESVQN